MRKLNFGGLQIYTDFKPLYLSLYCLDFNDFFTK